MAKEQQAEPAASARSCLSTRTARGIINECIGGEEPPKLNDTLEQAGLIRLQQRRAFKKCVCNGVKAKGCKIDCRKIPARKDTTIRGVRDAIAMEAHR